MKGPIDEKGLANLKQFQSELGKRTPLDDLLNRFWIKTVQFLPMWLAPNIITTLGALSLAFGIGTIFVHDLTLSEILPNWVYFANVLAIVVFQFLDAIDGKQARRTNNSTCLGQLFDRGVDALSCTCHVIMGAQMLQLGASLNSLIVLYCLCITFYASAWEEHFVGVLRLGVAGLGVTEGELLIAFCLAVTGFTSGKIWESYSILLIGPLLIGEALFFFNMLTHVLHKNKQKLRALSLLVPGLQIGLCSFFWRYTTFYETYPALVLVVTGIQYFNVSVKLIVSTMTKMHFSPLQFQPFFMLIPVVNRFFEYDEFWVFVLTATLTFFGAAIYIFRVVNQITSSLGIRCFTITLPKIAE